jgi:hypothetical protein
MAVYSGLFNEVSSPLINILHREITSSGGAVTKNKLIESLLIEYEARELAIALAQYRSQPSLKWLLRFAHMYDNVRQTMPNLLEKFNIISIIEEKIKVGSVKEEDFEVFKQAGLYQAVGKAIYQFGSTGEIMTYWGYNVTHPW